ncbi:FAD-dependent oxidoreductase [Gilvimarinus sp. F26214L]|uniref:FAD-dependent oxidoreductase n=1 Tax=Gilvimarinus sp. DZF01 TaxID=3461371 RepID=UPI004045C599
MTAVWNLGCEPKDFPRLDQDMDLDVVVVGGGITGLSTALLLSEAGERVALLEAYRVGSGCSGGSTGNLYSTLSQGLSAVGKKWDADTVRELVALRRRGLEGIEHNVERLGIDCQFERRSLYFCSADRNNLQSEADASVAAGLGADLVDSPRGLGISVPHALQISEQAQFNPLQYCDGLARAAAASGAAIFEHSPAIRVDASEGRVETPTGTARAGHIVFATHTPKGINMLQAEMEVLREHAIAAPMLSKTGEYPRAITWALDDSYSLRSTFHQGQLYLVLVGQKHQTGHHTSDYFADMEHWLCQRFEVGEVTHRWSAQQYRPADLLPFVGRSGHDNIYVATGFSADGLVWGELAAQVISGQILGRKGQGADLLNPRRFTPSKSAKGWLEANMKVARHLGSDYLGVEKLETLDQVRAGEGRVARFRGENYAIYRSPQGELSALSPVCPHMKCMVHWNAADVSWDCPCHGSRFNIQGEVLEGPAFRGLEKRVLPQ